MIGNGRQVEELMPIGQLSRLAECKVETIRYYESIGLLKPPIRSQGGHRYYGASAVKRLNFILRARKLGFPIDTIRTLLDLADGCPQGCSEVEKIALEHLQEVNGKIYDLLKIQSILEDMISHCQEGAMPECPLLETLYEGKPL